MCGNVYGSFRSLERHFRDKHSAPQRLQSLSPMRSDIELECVKQLNCKYCGRVFSTNRRFDEHLANKTCLKVKKGKKKKEIEEDEKAPIQISKKIDNPAVFSYTANLFHFPSDLTKIFEEFGEPFVAIVYRMSFPMAKRERECSQHYYFGTHKDVFTVLDRIVYKTIATTIDGIELKMYSDSLAWCPPSMKELVMCKMAFFGVKKSLLGYTFINSATGGWIIYEKDTNSPLYYAGNIVRTFDNHTPIRRIKPYKMAKARDFLFTKPGMQHPWLSFSVARLRILDPKELKLNMEQNHVFSLLKARIDATDRPYNEVDMSKANIHFVNGLPGTGKSYLLDALYIYCRTKGINCKVVAFTKMVANMYKEGATIHSYFGINFVKGKEETLGTVANPKHGNLYSIVNLRVLFIDEICCVRKHLLDIIDACLRRHHSSKVHFGGILVITMGDFNQLPPYHYDELDTTVPTPESTSFSAVDAYLENQVFFYSLESICRKRGNEDPALRSLMLKSINSSRVDFDPAMVFKSINDGINFVYGSPESWPGAFIKNSAVLCLTNFSVFEVNMTILSKWLGYNKKALSVQLKSMKIKKAIPVTTNLNQCYFEYLKEGCPLFCSRNTKEGIVNGAYAIYKRFHEGEKKGHYIVVQELDSRYEGKEYIIPKYEKQYPFDWGFALTVHKSQGRTFDKLCVVLLDEEPFMHGQLTVALTRVRCIDDLRIVKSNCFCKNVIDEKIRITAEDVRKRAINKK